MGLDNGIIIKIYDDSIKNRLVRFKEPYDENYYETCYMRKWWGVRNHIVNYLNDKYGTNHINDGEWVLDIDDLQNFIKIYQYWNNEETWENEHGSTIWSWGEGFIEENINRKIEDLKYLIALKRIAPKDFDLFFYDSY